MYHRVLHSQVVRSLGREVMSFCNAIGSSCPFYELDWNDMFKRPPRTAYNTIMNLLSRRNHSERELIKKLREREFSSEEIELALEKARAQKWIENPEKLSEQFAGQLHRKNKGIQYINSTLSEKGLPPIERDEALELDKALKLVKTKYSSLSNFTRKEKAKVARFLASRGFDSNIVRKVIFDHEEEL